MAYPLTDVDRLRYLRKENEEQRVEIKRLLEALRDIEDLKKNRIFALHATDAQRAIEIATRALMGNKRA